MDSVVKLRDITRGGTVPGWVRKAWIGSRRHGASTLRLADIDAEISVEAAQAVCR